MKKLVLTQKKIISTSKLRAKHPFACRNTRHLVSLPALIQAVENYGVDHYTPRKHKNIRQTFFCQKADKLTTKMGLIYINILYIKDQKYLQIA